MLKIVILLYFTRNTILITAITFLIQKRFKKRFIFKCVYVCVVWLNVGAEAGVLDLFEPGTTGSL